MAKSRKASQAIARRHDRDRAPLVKQGVRASTTTGARMRRRAIAAFNRRQDPTSIIRPEMESMTDLLIEAMVAADLRGRVRSLTTMGSRATRRVRLARSGQAVYRNAVEFARRRLDLLPEDITTLRNTYRPAAEQEIERTASFVEAKVQATFVEATTSGATVSDGINMLAETFRKAGIEPVNSYTLENIFRTNINATYSAARWQTLQAPEAQDILWGFEYVTVGDLNVRPNHERLDGTTLPKEDPMWGIIWPPNGWGCRCSTVELFAEEAIVRPDPIQEIDGVLVLALPDEGFHFNPGMRFTDALAA